MAGKSKNKKKGAAKKKSTKPKAAKKATAKKKGSSRRRSKPRQHSMKTLRKMIAKHGFRATVRTSVKKAQEKKKSKAAEAKQKKAARAAAARAAKKIKAKKKAEQAAARALKRAEKAQQRAAMYTMSVNPARRRRRNPARSHSRRSYRRNPHRRYRRNPGPMLNSIIAMVKKAAPVVGGMIVGRMAVKQISSRVAAISKLGMFQGPALAAGMLALGHVVTGKVKPLAKFRDQIMLGLGINLVTEVLAASPLKGMLGLGEGIYDRALSDYVTTSDYLTTGATPIDDDIALADYVTTGALEEELGLSEELGISEELGAIDAGTVPGGVSQLAMIKSVPHQSFSEEVPARSFTKDIGHAGQGYDNPGALYAGIFRGGF